MTPTPNAPSCTLWQATAAMLVILALGPILCLWGAAWECVQQHRELMKTKGG